MPGRSRFPRLFLQHRVVVRPYLSWDTWGPPVTVACLVDEQIAERFTRAGTVVRTSVRIFAPMGTVCPVGSKVTLPDGREGHAAGAAVKSGGRLPVPEHLEVVWAGALVASAAHAETVVLLRRTPTGGRDQYGVAEVAIAQVPVAGCAVELDSSTEDNTAGSRVTVTGRVVMPPGTDVGALDELRVRGLVYTVVGKPEVVEDSTAGVVAGVRVSIRRVTG